MTGASFEERYQQIQQRGNQYVGVKFYDVDRYEQLLLNFETPRPDSPDR